MCAEKEPKDAAKVCFDSIGLDPELYRIGHTKARAKTPDKSFCTFEPPFRLLPPPLDIIYSVSVDPCTCLSNLGPPPFNTVSLSYKVVPHCVVMKSIQNFKSTFARVTLRHKNTQESCHRLSFGTSTHISDMVLFVHLFNVFETSPPKLFITFLRNPIHEQKNLTIMSPVTLSSPQLPCKLKKTSRRPQVSAWKKLDWTQNSTVWATPRREPYFIISRTFPHSDRKRSWKIPRSWLSFSSSHLFPQWTFDEFAGILWHDARSMNPAMKLYLKVKFVADTETRSVQVESMYPLTVHCTPWPIIIKLNVFCTSIDDLTYHVTSYSILAPAKMNSEKDLKKAAEACLDSVSLDPELFRLGHTKARMILNTFHHVVRRDYRESVVVCFIPFSFPSQ